MEISSDIIIILFLLINIQTGLIIALIDSRNYWKKKWKDLIDENMEI